MRLIPKPDLAEYSSGTYIDELPADGRVLELLEQNLLDFYAALIAMPDAQLTQPYAPGKWTIKEVVGHLIDCERIFTNRALRFSRMDRTELSAFDQDLFVLHSGANARSISNLMGEFKMVRRATIAFFDSLPEDALLRSGTAAGVRLTVRAMAYHLAGHSQRHLRLIGQHYPGH